MCGGPGMSNEQVRVPDSLALLLSRIKVIGGVACVVLEEVPGLGEVLLVLPPSEHRKPDDAKGKRKSPAP